MILFDDNDQGRNTTEIIHVRYVIPKCFPSFTSMIKHWYSVVKGQDNSSRKEWRNHLSSSKKKRFQRLSRVMKAFQKVMNDGMAVTEAKNSSRLFICLKKVHWLNYRTNIAKIY